MNLKIIEDKLKIIYGYAPEIVDNTSTLIVYGINIKKVAHGRGATSLNEKLYKKYIFVEKLYGRITNVTTSYGKIDIRIGKVLRDYYLVQNDSQLFGLVDSYGILVIPFKYTYINRNSINDKLIVADNNNSYKVIDAINNILLDLDKTKYMKDFAYMLKNESVVVRNEELQRGVITLDYKEIIPCKYDGIYYFDDKGYVVEIFRENSTNLTGMYNLEGKLIIPLAYDSIYPIGQGMVCATINGNCAIYNERFEKILPCEYVLVQKYASDGYAIVQKDNILYQINTNGNMEEIEG